MEPLALKAVDSRTSAINDRISIDPKESEK